MACFDFHRFNFSLLIFDAYLISSYSLLYYLVLMLRVV